MKITDLAREIGGISSALIFSHVRPDGDTIGSAMALKEGLMELGIKADLICANKIPEKYSDYPLAKEFYLEAPSFSYDAHISVDCSAEQMFAHLSGLYFSNKKTFNIDHHVSNTRYAKYNYVVEEAACCENIFELLKAMGVKINRSIADSLMLGIVTDTGCFAHKNVTPSTLRRAADLVEYGSDLNATNFRMFKAQSIERAKLFSRVTSGLKLFHNGQLSMLFIREADFKATGATPDMTEGFIDYAMSVKGTEVAVSIMETGDKRFKISFRSRGKVNVNEVAGTFGGGGHILASGCMLNGYFEDVVDKLVFTVGNYL